MRPELIDIYSILLLDDRLRIVGVENADDRLFFGKDTEKEMVGRAVTELAEGTDVRNRPQLDIIVEGIRRALCEKRKVYLKYISYLSGGEHAHVTAHAVFAGGQTVCLQVCEVDEGDLQRAYEQDAALLFNRKSEPIQQTIYENLPIGVEVYDRDGKLIEVNPEEMKVMGVRNKADVLGIGLFENPNIPEQIKSRLRTGEDVHFIVEYDFDKAGKEYYDTSQSSIRHFDASISIVRDEQGAVDKYLLISQNITEQISLKRKYENLYNQTMTIMNSLPVGVELYDPDGNILFLNDTDCRIFGIDRKRLMASPVNIHQNPNLPGIVKNAVRDGVGVRTHFPYSFSVVSEERYYDTLKTQTVQTRFNGTPVLNTMGKVESYVFIVEDVTEAIRTEEVLSDNKRKTELSMRAADIMFWEFDVRTGLFTSENDPINGYDPAKMLTVKDYTDCLHADDREMALGYIEKMQCGEELMINFDVRIELPGYSGWQYCSISGSSYEKDADGNTVKYVGFRKNNTEMQKKKLLQEKILNSIPLPVQIKDLENGYRYVFCNDESKRMFGDIEGKTVYDVWAEKEVPLFMDTDWEVFRTGKPYFGKQRVVLKDGRSYDTMVRKNIVEDAGKRLLLCIYWDQSLQKELERRSKVLSISMDAMNAFTWYYDANKNELSYGEGFDKIGWDVDGVNSMEKFASHIHPDDRERFLGQMTRVLRQDKGDFAVEYCIDMSGTGNYEWWECRGILETVVLNEVPYKHMFGMDISIESHKKTELTLLKNREELNRLVRQNELVLNNTNSGLAYITLDYIVQWENVSMCSASLSYEAYKKGELCYKSAHNRTIPCENCVMQRAVRSRQVERIKFKLNNDRTVEVYSTPVFSGDDIDGIVIRVDDVTERERMIDELKEAKSLAEQSDKLKSAFLANMSHEIRTPLNAIVGFSDLLSNTEEPAEKEEYMQIISYNNELLLKLINDILDLSKIEAGSVELKYEEFDLSEYFDGMASSMKQRISNPDVQLITVNPYGGCYVRLDRNRIAQIMTNYVTNAIKYTPKGFIEMGYEQVDEGVRLYVRDTGIGISDEKKHKVFDRFEKLDEFAQGTGLGLSICKAIAESMGGKVGFDSTFGEGSMFWAVLPCDPEIRAVDGEDCAAMAVRKTVLVAEDISSNFMLVSGMLHKHCDLVRARNGREALEMVRARRFDLLLMDMKMPEMNGLVATAEIRKINTELPIVALTAHAFEADRQAAFAAGCNEYLVKPIDKAQLISVLRRYCGFVPSVPLKNGRRETDDL